MPGGPEKLRETLAQLRELAATATSEAEARAIISRAASLTRTYRIRHGIGISTGPLEQAVELDPAYRQRPHLVHLSQRLVQAVHDVERGRNRMLAVSMPPRSGKSELISKYGPLWLLRRHPEWSIVTASHDGGLTASWAKADRQIIEDNPALGISLAPDGGAAGYWQTIEGGGLLALSVRGALTGRGARVFIIDDPVKDFVEAHSQLARQALWDWWLSVAFNRLEPPYLVIVVMTRWHEDDFIGRLFSPDYEGDPRAWERISLPAVADQPDDVLGRALGEPMLSPLQAEDPEQALARWADVRRSVGTYVWSAMYQQRPAPAKGAIFDSSWWRFWTMDPAKATQDGRVVHLDPSSLTGGRWLDSWDAAFKGGESSAGSGGSWVVGQRWVRYQANRYLIAQKRGRWSFTQTIAQMKLWARTEDPVHSPCGHLVHQRLIEERANGAAIIDVLKEKISGLKPINPTISKEARARAVTPECESGNVYLPHPSDPGNDWVQDFLSELRNFPHDAADDQVDGLTQALSELRDPGRGLISVPGRLGQTRQPRNIAAAARSDLGRHRGSASGRV